MPAFADERDFGLAVRIPRPVDAAEMRTFADWEVLGEARADTCFHVRTGIASVVPWPNRRRAV